MQYRLLTGSHGRFEDGKSVIYRRGDLIELSSEEAATFRKGRIEPAEAVAASVVDDSAASEEVGEISTPAPPPRKQLRQTKHPKRRG